MYRLLGTTSSRITDLFRFGVIIRERGWLLYVTRVCLWLYLCDKGGLGSLGLLCGYNYVMFGFGVCVKICMYIYIDRVNREMMMMMMINNMHLILGGCLSYL